MNNPDIYDALRGHNEEEKYVEMEVYAEHRAADFAVAYLNDLIRKGELDMKDFKLAGCSVSQKPAVTKGFWVYEVYYQEVPE